MQLNTNADHLLPTTATFQQRDRHPHVCRILLPSLSPASRLVHCPSSWRLNQTVLNLHALEVLNMLTQVIRIPQFQWQSWSEERVRYCAPARSRTFTWYKIWSSLQICIYRIWYSIWVQRRSPVWWVMTLASTLSLTLISQEQVTPLLLWKSRPDRTALSRIALRGIHTARRTAQQSSSVCGPSAPHGAESLC